MRIPLTDLNRPKTLQLQGDEPWLARLYADFPLGKDRQLTGTLTLEIGHGGEVNVSGSVAFTPKVACSRCEKSIAWPVQAPVKARFMPARDVEKRREITLTESDLEAYFIEDGAVDLEQLLTDAVQTTMPTQLVRANSAGDACLVCHDDLNRDLVYGVGKPAKDTPASPFAALKDLKLKN